MSGIDRALTAYTQLVRIEQARPIFRQLAVEVTKGAETPAEKMRLIVDELHRRFTYAPDPNIAETIGPVPVASGTTVDVDDACLFVVLLATKVGVSCRLVGARYKQRWTLFVAYESGEYWVTVDVLRQHKVNESEERVMGEQL